MGTVQTSFAQGVIVYHKARRPDLLTLGFCSGFVLKQRFAPKEEIKNHLSQSPEPSEFIVEDTGDNLALSQETSSHTFWSIQPYSRLLLCTEYHQTR